MTDDDEDEEHMTLKKVRFPLIIIAKLLYRDKPY
jgi:hypothetical protein